jgi:hypothetical protein
VAYVAQLAKQIGAELLVVNVTGGYDLPDGIFKQFTHTQNAWLDEMLDAVSADISRQSQSQALSMGLSSVHPESRRGDVAQSISGSRTRLRRTRSWSASAVQAALRDCYSAAFRKNS